MFFRLLGVCAFLLSCYGFASRTSLSKGDTFHSQGKIRNSSPLQAAATLTAEEPVKKRGSSIPASTFNLGKSVVGVGVLSLPSAVGAFSDSKLALLPASIICMFFGFASAYGFYLIGKACDEQKTNSLQDAWSKSVSPKTGWIISGGITFMCFLASLANTLIIGDSFSSIFKTFNFPAFFWNRNNVILFFATFFLLPLNMLRSLASLAPFSILGLGGIMYTGIFMIIRLLDKSYHPGGKFFAAVAPKFQQSFNARGPYQMNSKVFVLISMLATAYIAHYGAPQFYEELENKSLPRFNKVVIGAFGFAIMTYVTMMGVGFASFGGNAAGFCLNNYAGTDPLATMARVAIGCAIVTGFPFTFSAYRDGLFDLLRVSQEKRDKVFNVVTGSLLAISTVIGLFLKDVGFIVSLSGAMFGSILMFVVPAMMDICNTKRRLKASGTAMNGRTKLAMATNYGMVGMGVVLTVLGVAVTVLKEFGRL
mmetsp:Transcript_20228/g.20338  ORF Transcript_20228/g.20338 Transcript_20228/m.20338 type:complete len:479 (-) Transcript_20228:75-1511(-)|eukprot:CAMPEP_0182428624 /NCGR_PEP_ID=MMETSP1167-20130531/23157_1 /TAXON_ID=2988 /ORGANISM="Mallomonas Sp, Strain CCMP3275" /LENGTH=478 /DNA_ID=CAMNT_0024611617 /DNA_START=55 /DNA_END=1491 /DNA_ORIENTATION=-